MNYNEFDQPIGEALREFNMPEFPNVQTLTGQYSRLEKLDMKHVDDLFNHFRHQKIYRIGHIYQMSNLKIIHSFKHILNNVLPQQIRISLQLSTIIRMKHLVYYRYYVLIQKCFD